MSATFFCCAFRNTTFETYHYLFANWQKIAEVAELRAIAHLF